MTSNANVTFYVEEVTDECGETEKEEERSLRDTGTRGHEQEKYNTSTTSFNSEKIDYFRLKTCPSTVGGGATLTVIGGYAYAYGGVTRDGKCSSLHCYDIGMSQI